MIYTTYTRTTITLAPAVCTLLLEIDRRHRRLQTGATDCEIIRTPYAIFAADLLFPFAAHVYISAGTPRFVFSTKTFAVHNVFYRL